MFCLVVDLHVRPERRDAFLTAIAANAAASVREEPGCLRFDVCQDVSQPDHFVLYEVYRDQAAYQEHRTTPHFATWRAAADATVVPGSQVNTGTSLVASAPSA